MGVYTLVVLSLVMDMMSCRHYDESVNYDEYSTDDTDLEEEALDNEHFEKRSTIEGEPITLGFCPENKPFPYGYGTKCCSVNFEDVDSEVLGCDGGVLTHTSRCCGGRRVMCPHSVCIIPETRDLVDEKRKEIEAQVSGIEDLSQFEAYVNSEDSLALYQYKVLNGVLESGASIDLNDEEVAAIYNDMTLLEPLITSGDITGNNWPRAMKILARIMREDPNAQEGVKFRLAVAIALTFSIPIIAKADKEEIDGIARYHNFAQWADEGLLMEPFFNLNIFELRHVVHGSARDEELIWARENVPDEFKDPSRIGGAVFSMVDYIANQPTSQTLEEMHINGGVCGTVCRFGSGMCQAFGIPASPMGQPGHCAFIWLNGSEFQLSNRVRGWAVSRIGGNIPHYSWRREASFLVLMHEVQRDPEPYRISERIRILSSVADPKFKCSLIENALEICPQNYALYHALDEVTSPQLIDRIRVEERMLPSVEDFVKMERYDIALLKPAKSCGPNEDRAFFLTEPNTFWVTDQKENAWVEIDLMDDFTIHGANIEWARNVKNTVDFHMLAETGGSFSVVKGKTDETEESTNTVSVLTGWDAVTSKVRLEMNVMNDAKTIIKIKTIAIYGKPYYHRRIVSLSMPVATNLEGDDQAGNLVDGNLESVWVSQVNDPWIEINFDGLCVIENVDIKWTDNIQGTQTFKFIVGNKMKEVDTDSGAELMGIATSLKVYLHGSEKYSIREISATGYCFSMVESLKIKIEQDVMDASDINGRFVINQIWRDVDAADCSECF